MQMKDRHDVLAKFGLHPVAILGNLATHDFEVVDLEAGPLGPEYTKDWTQRGLHFVGTLGILCGEFRQYYAVELPGDVTVALATDYAQFLIAKINNPTPKASGDGAEWLTRLWALPDEREAN